MRILVILALVAVAFAVQVAKRNEIALQHGKQEPPLLPMLQWMLQ